MNEIKEDVEIKVTEKKRETIKDESFELSLNQSGYAKHVTQVINGEIKFIFLTAEYYTNANVKLVDELGFFIIDDNDVEGGKSYTTNVKKIYAPLVRACDQTGNLIGHYVPYYANGKLTFEIDGGVPFSKMQVVIRYANTDNG